MLLTSPNSYSRSSSYGEDSLEESLSNDTSGGDDGIDSPSTNDKSDVQMKSLNAQEKI